MFIDYNYDGFRFSRESSQISYGSRQSEDKSGNFSIPEETPTDEIILDNGSPLWLKQQKLLHKMSFSYHPGFLNSRNTSQVGNIQIPLQNGTKNEVKQSGAQPKKADEGESIFDNVKHIGGDVVDKVKDIGGGAIDRITDFGKGALDGTNEIIDCAKNVVSDIGQYKHTVDDLTSKQNHVLSPHGNVKPPHELSPDGKLRVVTWNLHKGEGPNDKGKPPQTDRMIQEMRKAQGDVYLLQEVPPDEAQKIADSMGMKAYFTRTNPSQGNMILVNPELQVENNKKVIINGDIKPGDKMSAIKQMAEYGIAIAKGDNRESQMKEPRVAQTLRIKLPDGKEATLWNTHLTAYPPCNENSDLRKNQIDKIQEHVNSHAKPGEAVIGGGDLNSLHSTSPVEELRKYGFNVGGAAIDFIVNKNTEKQVYIISKDELKDENGIQISDHPMVVAEVDI